METLQSDARLPTQQLVDHLLEAHDRFLTAQFGLLLARYREELVDPFTQAKGRAPGASEELHEELGARALGVYSGSEQIQADAALPDPRCSEIVMQRPTFDFSSPLTTKEAPGVKTNLSRGNLDGTLEVAASVGQFLPLLPQRDFPGTPSGPAVFNRSTAFVGKFITLPSVDDFVLIDASAIVLLEQSQGRQPVSWENFIFGLPGREDGPLEGLSLSSCDISLAIHSAGASTLGSSTMAASDITATSNLHTNATLTRLVSVRAVLQPGTTMLSIFVNGQAFVFSDGTPDGHKAFAELSVHHRLQNEGLLDFGVATADGALRVIQLRIQTCPIPVLSQAAAGPERLLR
jgi:hypothetical protein